MTKLKGYVDSINANIEKLDTRGPVSKYVLPNEGIRGRCVLFLYYAITSMTYDVRSTSVGEGSKTFFIRVWKPLPSRHVLKTLSGSSKGEAQRGQYLLAVGLGRYKWYQSQTPSGVPARTLGLKEGWIVRSHIEWWGKWVSARTLGLEGRCIVRSHIGWRGEQNIFYKGVETSP